jgi:hypothetical protein
MTNEERLLAAMEYQQAMRAALGNQNLLRQGRRMNLPARQEPGALSEFVTKGMSLDPQPDQGYGTMAADMALSFIPGVGQAMAARDLERARRDSDPLGMALAGTSFVPFGKLIGALRGGKQMGPVSEIAAPKDTRIGDRISTRFPTAVAATEDPLTQNLIINTEAMRNAPGAFQKNADLVGGYNTTRTKARSAEGKAQAFTEEAADNLLWLYDSVPPEIRNMSKQWYQGANKLANRLADKHGVSVNEAGGVIASLSPQKDWYQNSSLADRVLGVMTLTKKGNYTRPDQDHARKLREIFSKPQYASDVKAVIEKPFAALSPEQKAMFVRSYDQAFNERGYYIISPSGDPVRKATTKAGTDATTSWGSNVEIAKAISVFEDPSIENISRMMGGQHKVRNFYNNIVDPNYAANAPALGDYTSDTHNVAAALLKPLGGSAPEVAQNFGGAGSASSSLTGAQGTYGLYADAGRIAAKERGIIPREMQSVTWEAVRGIYPSAFKTAGNIEDINNVWSLYKKGTISKDAARKLILEKAGGMDAPDWFVRPSSGVNVPGGGSLNKGGVYKPSVSGSGLVDGRGRLLAAGIPAAWMGLAGAGLLASEDSHDEANCS